MEPGSHLDDLNPAQRTAATFGVPDAAPLLPGPPLLIIAGAGSGKTSTLAHRVAHLVLKGADPGRILLLTFTRRAAEAMVRRAERICAAGAGQRCRVRRAGSPGPARSTPSAPGCCASTPTPSGSIPASPSSTAATPADLLDLVRDELGLARTDRRFPKKGTCLAIYSYAVNAQAPLDAVLRDAFPWCAEWAAELKRLFAAYVEAKQRQAVLDYDDLLLWWEPDAAQCRRSRRTWAAGSISSWSTSTRTPTPSRRRSCWR